MRITAGSLLFALLLSAASLSFSTAADIRNPSPDQALKTLRRSHPRLILLDDDLARVRKLIAEDKTARRYYEQLKSEARQSLDAQPVEYKIVGPRLLSQSRRCLSRVMLWSLMFRLEKDGVYADRAKKELFAAADFPDWNPSHFLDTAEMSHAFAIGYDWLYDYLTDAERATIRTALIEKGLKPAIQIYEKNGWWVQSRHNWNQVCNGGITIGALAIADEIPDQAGYIVSSAVKSIQRAMASYAPDGGWAEGPGYWHYATRYNVYFLAALESALGTDFGLSTMEGFEDAGLFRIYFCSPTGLTFNYADAGSRAGSASEMFWLARRFDRPVYAWHERHAVRSPDPWDLIWYTPAGQSPEATGLPLDRLFHGVDVAFFRSDWTDENAIFIGFKGGDNKANHSHLDLGSFVLDALDERWAVDLGGDNYNLPGYFGNQRWTYYRLRTESHNTLVLDDQNQDPRAAAPVTAFYSTPELAYAVADLSKAYAKSAGSVRRGIALADRRHVIVQDEIRADDPVEVVWGMLTPAEIEIDGPDATLSIDGARLGLRIAHPEGAAFETVSANPPPPQRQQPEITKLAIRLPDTQQLRLVVVMSPYASGQDRPLWGGPIRPLDQWVEGASTSE